MEKPGASLTRHPERTSTDAYVQTLGPRGPALADAVAATDARTRSGLTIVDLAIAEPQLSILVDAVQRAGLVDVLSAPGA